VPLKEYLRILWQRGWIIIVMAVVTTASAVAFSYVQRPVYRSTIYLNVIPARLDLGLTESIKSMMRNYAGNIVSNTTLQEVINRTGQDMTPETLRANVAASPIMEDYIIQVDVKSTDPQVAQLLAQTIGVVFSERIKTQMLDQDVRDRLKVELKDPASPPVIHSPKKTINALAGGVFGVLLGVLVVLGLEWVESGIIRSADDLERAAGAPVLGVIPEA